MVKQEEVIFTYDLHTGKFGEITVPYGGVDGNSENELIDRTGKLGELNGWMCYIYVMDYWSIVEGEEIRGSEYVVWVMKEYGSEDSWEKFVSIGCSRISEIKIWEWDSVKPAALYESEDGRKAVLFVCRYFYKWLECPYFEMMFWYVMNEDKIEVINQAKLLKKRKLQLKRKREFYSFMR